MLTSTLPRHPDDLQANFVGEQADAWATERPGDQLIVLAPHHAGAAFKEDKGKYKIQRFRYAFPVQLQRLAYPAILPNLRRNPLLYLQVPIFLICQYLAAKKLSRQTGANLVYAHWIMPQGLIAWLLKKSTGIPYILQNHSSDLAVFESLVAPGRLLAQAILEDCAHFFCVNSEQQDRAASLFEGRAREQFLARCTVLPMGIASGQQTKPDNPGHDLVTIGRFSRKKGIDLLIRAAEILASRSVRPRIALAGDGEERARLEKLVQRADISFAGFLTGDAKNRFLASAKCFAFPAHADQGDVEGMPVALLEALARGAPVLATRDSNVRLLPEWDAIRDHVVFIEDPTDIEALASAIEDLLVRRPDPRVARIMQRYQWPNLIHQYLDHIDRALDQAGFSATSK